MICHPVAPEVDPDALAARTVGWTGAGLEGLVRAAARHALARHIAAGHGEAEVEPIDRADFDAALAECAPRAAAGPTGGDRDDGI